jgi:hypothetical protein
MSTVPSGPTDPLRPTVPQGFPFDPKITNAQIGKAIAECQRAMEAKGYSVNAVIKWSPLITLGTSEIQNRRNTRIVRLSMAVAILALASSLAQLVSIWLLDSSGNQDSQLSSTPTSDAAVLTELQGIRAHLPGCDCATMIAQLTVMADHLRGMDDPNVQNTPDP